MTDTRTFFKQICIGPCHTNCYIFTAGDTVIVVDPGGLESILLSTIASLAPSAKTVQILLTHSHSDHFLGADVLLDRYPGSSVYISAIDEPGLYRPELNVGYLFRLTLVLKGQSAVKLIAEGDILEFGPYKIEVIATPGHTPGGVVFVLREQETIFTGDTLMRGKMGRTDLIGADRPLLARSIREKIMSLPPAFKIYAGHGKPTTVQNEKPKFG
jgi:glyoxylase-like metal-dependent hydrolase (beta-lactamase superfamily II)